MGDKLNARVHSTLEEWHAKARQHAYASSGTRTQREQILEMTPSLSLLQRVGNRLGQWYRIVLGAAAPTDTIFSSAAEAYVAIQGSAAYTSPA